MNEINEIRRQFQGGQWKQFLNSIKITNLRGWNGQTINFTFPVTAIVGENGMGKSTVLRSAACAYQSKTKAQFIFYPSSLFINTQWDSSALNGSQIEYTVQAGDERRTLQWKKTQDWGFSPRDKKMQRHVYFWDIARTLPLDATVGYAKLAKMAQSEGTSNVAITGAHLNSISHILGRKYVAARFTNTNMHADKEVGLLELEFGEMSQFHQGAGEDTILDTFKLVQTIPEQSLLIIDEVEASLHPLAQRRYIKELLKLSRVKKIQIILSTHSPFVLEELPPEARVLIMKYGKEKQILREVSTQFALSAIDEKSHPEIYIYVEDNEARTLLQEIVKSDRIQSDILMQKIEIKPVGSAHVVDVLFNLASEGKLPDKSISFIDGDKRNEYPKCPALPGHLAPERMVLLDLHKNGWKDLDGRFGIGAGTLFKILDDAILLPDHHDWTTRIGDQVKKSKDYVWQILVEEWCKQCLSETQKSEIFDHLNRIITP